MGAERSPGLRDRLHGAAGRRVLSLLIGLPTWAVLATAISLSPDPRGFGTHRQLGLGTCTVMRLTGYPCPMCGMTTCFTHMAHLDPLGALLAQPFGVVLFLVTLGLASVAAVELISPRGRWERLLNQVMLREQTLAMILVVGLLSGWVYKLWSLGHLPI